MEVGVGTGTPYPVPWWQDRHPRRERVPNQKDIMAANSNIRVESRSTDTDGSEVSVIRTTSNLYDIRWDVKDISWTSVYIHSGDTCRLSFGSLGGVDMTTDTAVKVFNDLQKALSDEGLLDDVESVV